MSRIAAAYNALHEHLEPNEAADTVDYCCADLALAAADAVMFSDKAIERAVAAIHGETSQYFSGEGIAPEDAVAIVRAVVAALKADA